MKNFYYLIEKGKTPTENDFDILYSTKDDLKNVETIEIEDVIYEIYNCNGDMKWNYDYNEIIICAPNKEDGIIASFIKDVEFENFTMWKNGKKTNQ